MVRLTAYTFSLVLLLLGGLLLPASAQQSDTTDTTRRVDFKQREIPQAYHSERSTDKFLLPESGTYAVPEPTEYYKPPFTGQESLDQAVAAYREELENSIANTPLFRFINKIAPFVNNTFEFGVYRMYDIPIIDRDHPMLYPSTAGEQQPQ